MLTPAFELTQNDEYLILCIKAPHAKVSETEIYFQDNDFKFYSKPYYLRLKLPGQVEENGKESAQYDSDKGSFVINIPKKHHGEVFEGLNLLTQLLAPTKCITVGPLIEMLDSKDNKPIEIDDDFSWEIEQTPCEDGDDDDEVIKTPFSVKYGFANNYCGVLNKLKEEIVDCVDLANPDDKTVHQRQKEKFETEIEQFNDDHYLADLYEDERIQELLKYKQKWEEQKELTVQFTEEEKTKMLRLPNKDYLLDKKTKRILFLGLIDILLSYSYNARATEGENSVESAWNICKLSGTLSWLVNFHSLKEVAISFMRRSLCYPLYRHWKLSLKVIEDTRNILYLGREYVLRCLLEIHSLLTEYESKYIINDLYITDYCIWIQSVNSKTLTSLADELQHINISKESVKLDLVEIEEAAKELVTKGLKTSDVQESQNVNSITNNINEARNECRETAISKLCEKIDKIYLNSQRNHNHAVSTEEDSDSSGNSTDSDSDDYSDDDTSSSIGSSFTDSDDYTSSDSENSDTDDDNISESISERCCLLAKQRE